MILEIGNLGLMPFSMLLTQLKAAQLPQCKMLKKARHCGRNF